MSLSGQNVEFGRVVEIASVDLPAASATGTLLVEIPISKGDLLHITYLANDAKYTYADNPADAVTKFTGTEYAIMKQDTLLGGKQVFPLRSLVGNRLYIRKDSGSKDTQGLRYYITAS